VETHAIVIFFYFNKKFLYYKIIFIKIKYKNKLFVLFLFLNNFFVINNYLNLKKSY